MAPSKTLFLLLLVLITCFQEHTFSQNSSFPLTFLRLPKTHGAINTSLASSQQMTRFNYTIALIAYLPFGTPSQSIPMVLDTGSQLVWMACDGLAKKGHRFYPSNSKTFSFVSCKNAYCPINDPSRSLGIGCDLRNRCTYDYYYVDETEARGNIAKDMSVFSSSQSYSLILGCTDNGTSSGPGTAGIFGMSRGPRSFVSQAKIQTFSYCVPKLGQKNNQGTLIFGFNPGSPKFQYVGLLPQPKGFLMPNYNRLLYSVPLVAIGIGGTNISVPQVDHSGGGQSAIDSGSQYTNLNDAVFDRVAARVSRLVRLKQKTRYTSSGGLTLCFYSNSGQTGNMVGDIFFYFKEAKKPVISVMIPKENLFDDVAPGVACFAFVRYVSDTGINIIGSFQQQNIWIEHDVTNHRVGFGAPGCNTN